MSQFEQENDLGRGGGEVDEDTAAKAWDDADERRSGDELEEEDADEERSGDELEEEDGDEPQPWAKLSSGDADEL